MAESFDYVVIGAGPGGYSSAIRAAQLGLKTAVVEKENAGGVCLNWGCIPTKALLTSAHLYEKVHAGKLGLIVDGMVRANLAEIVDRSRQVAERLRNGVKSLFRKYNVTLFEGAAIFSGKSQIRISGAPPLEIRYKNACIATGARARALPQIAFSEKVWQYRDALVRKELPETLIVVGGGAIGLEFADFYNALGSKVTLIEMAPHILPADDEKIATALRRALEQKGINFFEGANILNISESSSTVEIKIKAADGKEETLRSQTLLVAIGVQPNTENLGIDDLGVLDEKKFVRVNEDFSTAVPDIYAIGDVTAGKLLAHRAAHQGIYVAEKLAGHRVRSLPEIPGCIYTSPQVATIGLGEKQLREAKRDFKIGEFPWIASGMALAAAQQAGFTRVFTDNKTGEILGAQIVGENAAELLGQVSLAMGSELIADDFLYAIMPHPTLAETVFEAFAVAEAASVNY